MPGPQPAGGPPSGPPSGPLQIPPGVPPAFFIPPSDGDVDKGSTVLGVTWAFAALSLIFFALRVYSRRVLTRNMGIEDGIMLIALALILAESALVTKAVEHGIGRHMFFVGPVEFVYALKWQIIAMPFAIIGSCVPKLVVTMLLIKILNPGKLAAAFLWTLNIVLFAISISTSVVALVQCTPTSAQWTHAGNFTCWDPKISTNVGLSQGSFAALVDFVLALYPVTAIWNLQMSMSNKIGVSILMGLGVFSGVGAIVKTTKLTKLTDKNDVTWELWSLVLWVMLELNIVFICACVPAIRPLWTKYSPKLSSTKGGSGAPYAYGSSGKNSFAMGSKGKKLGPEKDVDLASRGSETQLTHP